MKKAIAGLVLFGAATLFSTWLWGGQGSQSARLATPNPSSVASLPKSVAHNHSAVTRVPAYQKLPPKLSTLAPTLSPELFSGNKRLAYQAAKEVPLTLAQLPCFCHCDRGHGHSSLHSCFETEHGENCGICIGEALMAYQLEKQAKLSVVEIRQRIIAAYGKAPNE